jgi:tRNA1(Val) A37 N6-methylase TrmN6
MLDVGCNEGLVTLAVAAQFNCASTTGVDIDRDLISKACRCVCIYVLAYAHVLPLPAES